MIMDSIFPVPQTWNDGSYPSHPRWLAFTRITAASQAARVFNAPKLRHGPQEWTVAGAQVFVVTNPNGANARGPWDKRQRKVDWWMELARLVHVGA